RGNRREARAHEKRPVAPCGRREPLLVDELQQVGDRLQRAAEAGPVRAVAQLHPSHDLALGEGEVRERDHHEGDDDERLDEAHPPVDGLCHAFVTSTSGWRSPACSSATRTTPSSSLRLTRARSSTEIPSERTSTESPFAIPRLPASPARTRTARARRWRT